MVFFFIFFIPLTLRLSGMKKRQVFHVRLEAVVRRYLPIMFYDAINSERLFNSRNKIPQSSSLAVCATSITLFLTPKTPL